MILDTYGMFVVVCDCCREPVEDSFESFSEALEWVKNNGWESTFKKSGWENICPDCLAYTENYYD